MGYQLQSCVLRDMMNCAQATVAYQKAFHVAQELDDVELMASALARQGVTLIQQERPKEAIIYLSGALDIINAHHAPLLKGHIFQALSEAYAKNQQSQESWYHIGQAETYLGKQEHTQERSLIRGVTQASLSAQKGVNAVLLQEYGQAIRLIDESLTTYDPALIRGRGRLLAQKAEACYGLGILDDCISHALTAVTLARSAGSRKTEDRIKTLHTKLAQSPWRKEQSVSQLEKALSTP
jgi:tetratricopeptide (TPR) repeat protein